MEDHVRWNILCSRQLQALGSQCLEQRYVARLGKIIVGWGVRSTCRFSGLFEIWPQLQGAIAEQHLATAAHGFAIAPQRLQLVTLDAPVGVVGLAAHE